MADVLTAPLMTEDGRPAVGVYALKGEGFPVLPVSVTDGGRFEVYYVSDSGGSGGASMWWDADKFTVLKSPLDVIRCNIHHASRMAARAKAEAKKHTTAEATYVAALEAMRALEDNG